MYYLPLVAVPIKSNPLPEQVGAAAMVDNTAVGRLIVFRIFRASDYEHFIPAFSFSFTAHNHGMTIPINRTYRRMIYKI